MTMMLRNNELQHYSSQSMNKLIRIYFLSYTWSILNILISSSPNTLSLCTGYLLTPPPTTQLSRPLLSHPYRLPTTTTSTSHHAITPRLINYYGDEDVDEKAEIVDLDDDDELDWISDRELVRRATQETPNGESLTGRDKRTLKKIRSAGRVDSTDFFADDVVPITVVGDDGGAAEEDDGETTEQPLVSSSSSTDTKETLSSSPTPPRKSPYTPEEESLISLMGGKDPPTSTSSHPRRAPGYLGDSTLKEIAHDYSIPICYIADVLVSWGSPIPIDVDATLGDLVTGEQAFALLEAIHTLDVGMLQDRYSDVDLMTVCEEWGVEPREAFELCLREGWNLPFGMRTFLRRTQEEELIKVLAPDEY